MHLIPGRLLTTLLALGGLAALLPALAPAALAQTEVPDAPTDVAVYTIRTTELEVRWSSSDAANTTSFKLQWKSGSQAFDTTRQLTSDPATSIESLQSTSAGDRYTATITGLTDGTEYTVRVIATNANGDSAPSSEATGTPSSTLGQASEFMETEVVEVFEGSYPWLREAWDYITTQSVSVTFLLKDGGRVEPECPGDTQMEANLRKCSVTALEAGRYDPRLIMVITHELAHVYTLANGVAATPGPLGIALLYFFDVSPPGIFVCHPTELYADALTLLTLGDASRDSLFYWDDCRRVTDTLTTEALALLRSVAAGAMPDWLADTYDDSSGNLDLPLLWADIKATLSAEFRALAVFQLRQAFGGYCDNRKATESAFGSGLTRNPWSDGGCVPQAPTSVSATTAGSGTVTVSWQEPLDDGGSPIEGYRVQWKSGGQRYSSSRLAVLGDPASRQHTIRGLANDVSHTIQVKAYNHNGDGTAAEVTVTPLATDTAAPVLLTARIDRNPSSLRLTFNEPLDASSVPAASAFTLTINGASRAFTVGLQGTVVTLSPSGGLGATDIVTVGYSPPTDPTATRLKDAAGNNVPGFSGRTVRNDATTVAFTSDPGSDNTYAWNNGDGGQDEIEATVTFSEPVVVSGVPELRLQIGNQARRAVYHSGSGTASLVFRHPVTEDDIDDDGIAIPGGAIEGLVRYASTMAEAPARVRLSPQAGHLVEATRPVLLSAGAFANTRQVKVKWSESLDESSVPFPTSPGFKFWDFIEKEYVAIEAVAVEGNFVTLTLPSPVEATDRLIVSYSVAAVNPLRDTAGNYAGLNNAEAAIATHPNSPPEFPGAEDGARAIDEGPLPGRNIGAPVAATDADSDPLTYSISGTDAAFFSVVRSTGQLRTSAALDYDTRSSYSFTLRVTDARDVYGGADPTIDDTITVTVTVNDVDTRQVIVDPVIDPVIDPVVIDPIRPPALGGGGGGGGGGPSGPTPSDEDFEWTVKHDLEALDRANSSPTGLWSDGTTLWVGDNPDGSGDAVYAYHLESGNRTEDREFALDASNRAPRGIWSDRTTVWVSDSGQERLFAYDLATGDPRPDRDLDLAARNRDARGIWSDGQTMWVLDGIKDSLFAYDLATGAFLAEYALDPRNGNPRGIWSDGVTVWVSDPGASPRRLFAYRLPTLPATPLEQPVELERVRDEDFDKLSDASNNSPRGIWSDGRLMYVVDASDGKVYTYNFPDSLDARLASLTLSDVDLGDFSPLRYDYTIDTIPHGNIATLTATPVQPRASLEITPPDHDGDPTNGHHLRLLPGLELVVTVTSPDGSRSRTYTVMLGNAPEVLELTPGWTTFQWPGRDGAPVAEALAGISEKVVALYRWDPSAETWLLYAPALKDAPGANTLTTFATGSTYWIATTEPIAWTVPAAPGGEP